MSVTSGEIRDEIRQSLPRRGLTVSDVAAALLSSRSSVQRALARDDTTFSAELRRARQERAMDLILRRRFTIERTAREVGVTPDHLRTLLRPLWGVSPGRVRRAVQGVQRVEKWKSHAPPRHGTPWYWVQWREWHRIHKDLHELLAALPEWSPLRRWAIEAVDYTRRPDYRRQPYRDLARDERTREAKELEERLRDAARWQRALIAEGWPTRWPRARRSRGRRS